jgi:hypothetical protein
MTEQDDQDMTGLPIHVRVKAQAANEQDAAIAAAAEERQRQLQAAPPMDASEPTPQNGTQPQNQEPPAETQPDATRTGAASSEDSAALKGKVVELETQLADAENRLKTHYGRQRKIAEDKANEIAAARAEIEALKSQISQASPEVNSDEKVLRAHGWTDEDFSEATPRQITREAANARKLDAMRGELESKIQATGRTATASAHLNAMDSAINAAYPGFTEAIRRDGSADIEWSIFASEQNPDSSESLTFGETFDQAKKLGNREAALRVIALFVKQNPRLSFKDTTGVANQRVDIPPLRLMPSSGPAPVFPGSANQDANATPKPRYSVGYALAFAKKAAMRQDVFKPFTVDYNGKSKTFSTKEAMMREREALDAAGDEGRLIKD